MITLKEFLMDRDKEYPLTTEQALNAADLLSRVNWLFAKLGIVSRVTSGYRPGHYNKAAGGAKKSAHLECKAIDVHDPTGVIGNALKNNVRLLEECGLWLEHPDYTKGWVHLDTRQRKNTVFIP